MFHSENCPRELTITDGPGTGSFTLGFGQLHMMVQVTLKRKQAVIIGTGSGVKPTSIHTATCFMLNISIQIWNRVHILDLSKLYVLLIEAILDQKPNLPSGKTGYYFTENGYQSWKSIAQRIGDVGKKIGAFETSDVGEITLLEAAEEFYDGHLRDAEGVLASKYVFHPQIDVQARWKYQTDTTSARTRADRARQILGWNPTHGEFDFLEEIDDVVTEMYNKKSSNADARSSSALCHTHAYQTKATINGFNSIRG